MTLACGASPGQERAGVARPEASASAPHAAVQATSGQSEEAHRLVVGAVACWFGGVWSDAEGDAKEARAADAERRCHELVKRVYGADDDVRYERIRALERVEVAELEQRILAVAANASENAARRQQLGRFFNAVADAERETLLARRAGERVKRDLTGERLQTKLTDDQAAAVAPLSESWAFDALLHGEFAEFTPEAHAVAILCAMERMETARGLTKHLKVYALEAPFAAFFAVSAPDAPRDARQPLKGGTWLAYLTAVAQAAGHPVPDSVTSLPARERLAWAGAAAGLNDQLRRSVHDIGYGTDLKWIVREVVQRIDAEYRTSVAEVLREPVSAPASSLRP